MAGRSRRPAATRFGLDPRIRRRRENSAAAGSLERMRKRGYLLYGFDGERPVHCMAEEPLVGSEIELARAGIRRGPGRGR